MSVEPDAVDGLAAELLGLAAGLSTEADECDRAVGLLRSAAVGDLAAATATAGRAWSQVIGCLAQGNATFSSALYTVAAEYRAADAALAQHIGSSPAAEAAGPR
ncbi:hypothetical protein [Geodermatophilus sp. DSM 44513]|uniref:hypothetical protein n=1 Tax=Geodermatophilus sp. DSM 44513 TaxID=1528104 RepID=UPI0014134673|nr:hypothetical protein [Geodermatophilus sp. DSM 44513]WNV76222.1 hypothetical protein RTG05_02840 [Geodermatophilus sp. DSM 44513]